MLYINFRGTIMIRHLRALGGDCCFKSGNCLLLKARDPVPLTSVSHPAAPCLAHGGHGAYVSLD